MDLEATEIRVLGCLLEKQCTTPDVYPLSLNALRLACNQSTNRDPVVDYDEATVRDALHRLGRRRWTRLASGAGSRAPKYRHLLEEALPMGRGEQAILCTLMLRGAQTPGGLKQRADRMHPFDDLQAVNDTLERLIGRGLVARLDRRPGQKEERYAQLLGEDEAPGAAQAVPGAALAAPISALAAAATAGPPVAVPGPMAAAPGAPEGGDPDPRPPSGAERTAALEARVAGLERALAALGDGRLARLEREVAELREALGG